MSKSGEVKHVSDTALWVAIHRAAEGLRPDAMYKDPLAYVLAGERGLQIAKHMSAPKFMEWMMSIRTVAIDDLIREAIANGVDTVINLGAGLDTRPYRMGLPASVQWIEVDFPGMIELKNTKLADQTPTVTLSRIALDLGDRIAAQALYQRLGANTKKALIITEGVIPYLTTEQASNLANDLYAIPTFQYWIQDYRLGGFRNAMPTWYTKKLKSAPFQFMADDWMRFFAERGWNVKHDIPQMDEAKKRGRIMPREFSIRMILWIISLSKEQRKKLERATGYALFERKPRG